MSNFDQLDALFSKIEFPAIYPIKFIVPVEKYDELMKVLEQIETEVKFSKKSNYASVSAKPYVYSKENLIEIYMNASKIEGLISL